jgi:hypothetical protein
MFVSKEFSCGICKVLIALRIGSLKLRRIYILKEVRSRKF